MHHFKTKEFHHRVRRKQGQRNQWERCCGNHCCCWAASAPCSQAALRLLGCYRSQLPPFRCFHSPNLKLIKKKKYIPTFHPFPLSTICTVRLGRQIINPRPNFLDWLTLEMHKFSHLSVFYQSASEITLPHLSWWHCLKAFS